MPCICQLAGGPWGRRCLDPDAAGCSRGCSTSPAVSAWLSLVVAARLGRSPTNPSSFPQS